MSTMRKPTAPIADPAPIVYVVDDDPSVRAALEDLLASMGLQVRAFASTQAFLEHDLEDAPACLVLDVRMPGQSGLEFHRTMGSHGLQLPVVFITGHGDIAMVSTRSGRCHRIPDQALSRPGTAGCDPQGHRDRPPAPREGEALDACSSAGTRSTRVSARWSMAWCVAASTSRSPATSASVRSR